MNPAGQRYAWSELRAGWRRRLLLVGVLALVGAVALGAAAGARRTGTAVDRFLDEQRAFDVLVFCGPPGGSGDLDGCRDRVAAADEIAEAASVVVLPAYLSVAGRNVEVTDDTCYSGSGDVSLVVASDGRFGTTINAQRLVAGRFADPSKPDEVVITRELSRRTGLAVGDSISAQLFAGADCLDPPSSWQPARSLTVVGIQVAPAEVRPESGDYLVPVYGTPALLEAQGESPDVEVYVGARLRPGRSFDQAVASLAAAGVPEGAVLPGSLNADNLRRSVEPFVTALWLTSALTILAGLVLVGQLLSRQVRSAAPDLRRLGQLGLTTGDRLAVGLVHVGSVVLPAALLAIGGAYLLSSLMPLGLARIVEVDPGRQADGRVLVLGAVGMVAALVAVTIPAMVVGGRMRADAGPVASGRAGALASRLGGGPVATTGIRMAFEPLRGPSAPPMRTGFGVILAAVTLLVSATLFAGSITHLLASEHLVGWNWDAIMFMESEDDEPPVGSETFRVAITKANGVESAVAGTVGPVASLRLGEESTELQVFSMEGGEIGPTLISGRKADGPDEIVLGPETMRRLGVAQGDQVPYVAVVGEWEQVQAGGGTEVPGELTIVGTGVIPGSGGDSRLGTGGAVDFELYRALVPDATPDGVFVRLESGASLREVEVEVAEALGLDGVSSFTSDILGEELIDVAQVRNLPIGIAAALALLAGVVVAQVVVGSAVGRRGELGILRALGMRPRQVRGAVVVQALAISGAVVALGIPLGIGLGRAAWRTFALGLGTKPEVSIAWGWLMLLVIGLVVAATTFGLLGTARPRRQLAAALRRE